MRSPPRCTASAFDAIRTVPALRVLECDDAAFVRIQRVGFNTLPPRDSIQHACMLRDRVLQLLNVSSEVQQRGQIIRLGYPAGGPLWPSGWTVGFSGSRVSYGQMSAVEVAGKNERTGQPPGSRPVRKGGRAYFPTHCPAVVCPDRVDSGGCGP